MRALVFSPKFKRAYRRFVKRDRALRRRADDALGQMRQDVFAASLRTHKLSGELSGLSACSCEYDCRMCFFLMRKMTKSLSCWSTSVHTTKCVSFGTFARKLWKGSSSTLQATRKRNPKSSLATSDFQFYRLCRGAQGGTRTRTPSRTTDFKSVASTIPPPGHVCSDQ